jgi:putative spermidine/putrescine transport system substrate-binding protein/spermidine/putrescine transport system substrate-binding protein
MRFAGCPGVVLPGWPEESVIILQTKQPKSMKKQFFQSFAAAVLLLIFGGCSSGTKTEGSDTTADTSAERFKGKTLNILCWEGYADEAFTKAFADKYGVTVKGTYFGSSDELVSKLQSGGGSAYDLVSPSSDVASYLIDADLVQPVDLSKMGSSSGLPLPAL